MQGMQDQKVIGDAVPGHGDGGGSGSNRIVALDSEGKSTLPPPPPRATDDNKSVDHHQHHDKEHDDHHQPHQKAGWRKFMSFVGPGFIVSIAYLDPGNLETDLQAGATYGYELLWVVLIGMVFALIIQSLAANLGVSTGKHLAELCKAEYPIAVKYCLWLLAEVAVIAADIPEVIGTAFALNILFHIPLFAGVLLTGCSTLLLLGLQRYGVRKLEMLIALLVFTMAACFFGEMSYVKPPASDVLKGMFIPKLSGQGATGSAVALLGALVMPHNLFLHSALVLSRKVPRSVRGINNVLGRSSSTIYAIALLASGQSSTITGTYAGQYIMQGFLNLKMKKWIRNLLTRCIAITPSLIVSIIGGSSGAGQLIIIASMILSFELPFALIPLLKFSSSTNKMGPHKNSVIIMVISWILGFGIIAINIYYLSKGFVGWLIHNSLPKVANVFVGIIVFPLMAVYIFAVIYLTFRRDTVVTFVELTKHDLMKSGNIEIGSMDADGQEEAEEIPYRKDLADIPLPE